MAVAWWLEQPSGGTAILVRTLLSPPTTAIELIEERQKQAALDPPKSQFRVLVSCLDLIF